MSMARLEEHYLLVAFIARQNYQFGSLLPMDDETQARSVMIGQVLIGHRIPCSNEYAVSAVVAFVRALCKTPHPQGSLRRHQEAKQTPEVHIN
ncbi:hypothetical protein EVAR_102888_1 [Eumeta japonica]|uniref:Uncharacterized protein n=1 Tax=Eumeta variegata TaxID=151549 RepID=A0A4C1UMF9_EUMVA|nr:hypothetical protein EVAR_102888_1 [Eumeta japonica]